jgi:nickel/cobalt exporter
MSTLSELLLAPGVFSLGSALVLGAAHAITPGHGKTVVAAYLAGTRGNAFDALRLGLIVTFTHTASVFVLGLLAYYLTENIDLREWYPFLNKLSGVLIAVIGAWLLYQRLRPRPQNISPQLRAADHPHGVSLKALGVSGGIVPCPEALSLLLLSLSRGQSIYGLVLLVSFSLGLALVLVGLGLVAVFVMPATSRFEGLSRTLPIMSALVLIILGLALLL